MSEFLLLRASDFKILGPDIDGKFDPSQDFTKGDRVIIDGFLRDTFKVGLDELELLILFVGLLFGSEGPVFRHLLEDVFIVEEDFGLFPGKLIGVALANVISALEFQDVEKRLDNSWELDDIEVSEISDLLFPLLWNKWSVNTTTSSHGSVIVHATIFIASHGACSSVTTGGLEFVFLHSFHLGSVLGGLIRCIESCQNSQES